MWTNACLSVHQPQSKQCGAPAFTKQTGKTAWHSEFQRKAARSNENIGKLTSVFFFKSLNKSQK